MSGAVNTGAGRPLRVVVTEGAGFIGRHVCRALLDRGDTVWAVDSFDPFYDPAIKREGIRPLLSDPRFRLVEADIRDGAAVEAGLAAAGAEAGGIDAVVHLAARVGVRPRIAETVLYSQVNVEGTVAVLELARRLRVPAFAFASSSSVYGDSAPVPFSESDPVGNPISPYAATKRAGELLAHTCRHLYGMSVVCLRFFTVSGPPAAAGPGDPPLRAADGRRREEIPFFGDGSTRRDYTWVDDIVQGVTGAVDYALAHPGGYELINPGESDTVALSRLVELLAGALGVEPRLRRLPLQPGDVERTCADISRARDLLGYAPATRIEEGIPRFVEWFRSRAG